MGVKRKNGGSGKKEWVDADELVQVIFLLVKPVILRSLREQANEIVFCIVGSYEGFAKKKFTSNYSCIKNVIIMILGIREDFLCMCILIAFIPNLTDTKYSI